jgi:hypothetical protein
MLCFMNGNRNQKEDFFELVLFFHAACLSEVIIELLCCQFIQNWKYGHVRILAVLLRFGRRVMSSSEHM